SAGQITACHHRDDQSGPHVRKARSFHPRSAARRYPHQLRLAVVCRRRIGPASHGFGDRSHQAIPAHVRRMIDYSVLLYDPVYAEIGVPATLTVGVASPVEITVIDDTRAKTQTSITVEVRSVGPGAFARIPELEGKGITRDNYKDATL